MQLTAFHAGCAGFNFFLWLLMLFVKQKDQGLMAQYFRTLNHQYLLLRVEYNKAGFTEVL